MGDVHTLAGVRSKASEEVKKSDDRFTEYKEKVADATSLTVLDAMITQLQNYKDQVCKNVEFILHEDTEPDEPGEAKMIQPKIAQIRRYNIFPVKRLTSRDDVDGYLDTIREELYETLEKNDGIQII
jgi:cell division septum initiation protein DivIVA